jgi:hypothetical protein
MHRYLWSVVIFLIAAVGAVLYVYETFEVQRLSTESIRLSVPKINSSFVSTPEEAEKLEREVKQEDAERQARLAALVAEGRKDILLLRTGLFACFAGIAGGFLTFPGFMRGKSSFKDVPLDHRSTLFISYNHKNLELAQQLQSDLRGAGADAELIEAILDVQTDEELRSILKSQILNHPAVVVLLTPESLMSNWVDFERTLADTSLVSIIYARNRVNRFRSLWATHFLPRSKSFRAVRMLKAQRRYVDYPGENAVALITGYLDLAIQNAEGLSPLRQFLASFTSLDKLFFNWLFNKVESRVILAPGSGLWRAVLRLCMALQVYLALGPVLLLLGYFPMLVEIFAG